MLHAAVQLNGIYGGFNLPCLTWKLILMALERTFSILKPDATRRNITGKILSYIEAAGLRVIAQKRIQLSKEQAEGFYAVHKDRPFFNDLVSVCGCGLAV